MRKRAAFAAVFIGAVGVGAGVGVWAWANPGDTGTWQENSNSAASDNTETQSQMPPVIPAVRSYTPASGLGWRPEQGDRVVVGDPELADEGRLIASELGLKYVGQKSDARLGDLRLTLRDTDKNPESYTVTVHGGRVEISAPTAKGAFYGTRTLKQEVHGGGIAPEGVVHDEPAKPIRGFMLDIARKPYSEAWIEERIRELGDLKYNELDLHFSDDQAFRIESTTHPETVSQVHLTKVQVKRIVDLAASRHITVVPELDSPGHLGAVLAAHPELQLRNANGVVTKGAIDISNPASAKLIDDLMNEFADLFPGSQWNLGGDEYRALTVSDPQTSYPKVATAARQKYGPDAIVADVTTSWLNERAATVRAHHKTVRAWNDGFFRVTSIKPAQDLQVGYWTGKEFGAREPVNYLDAGRKVINYNDEYLYYVLGQPQTFMYPTGQRIYEQWTPRVLRGTTAVSANYDKQILGGAFAVWSDFPNAQTEAQVAAGIRMPLRATAQKLWNPGKPAMSWAAFKKLADHLS
ncbi:glycoside hydrolase family 20 protein [Streptomyces sp. NPDC088354]|uniref:beta-N-acetylhexosaminidase n=1 Tax=Streptomyces sp. NPDC088354 TaxID=3365856 RepID=UPI0037F9505D